LYYYLLDKVLKEKLEVAYGGSERFLVRASCLREAAEKLKRKITNLDDESIERVAVLELNEDEQRIYESWMLTPLEEIMGPI